MCRLETVPSLAKASRDGTISVTAVNEKGLYLKNLQIQTKGIEDCCTFKTIY